jgi:uncharacterized repeat protein (TIGR01451 family)
MKTKKLKPHLAQNQLKWFRFALPLLLAGVISALLLFVPVAAGTSLYLSLARLQDTPISLSIPLGVEIVQAAGGLTITKIAPATVNQGEILTYTLFVNNNTGQVLTTGNIIDSAPLNTTCNTTTPPLTTPVWFGACAFDSAGWVLAYSPPTFPTPFNNNTTSVVTFSVVVSQPLPDQSVITNATYSVSAANGFSSFSDIGVPITTVVNAPNWEISKIASPGIAEPGQPLTYTLTITNSGHLTTSGVYTITDQVPQNTDFVSASAPGNFNAGNVTWVLTNPIGINQAISVDFTVVVTQPLNNAVSITNSTYSVSGGNVLTPDVGAEVIVRANIPVTLTLSKSASPDPVQAGDLLTYTINVTNDNSSKGPAGGVVISDTVPANTTLVDAGFLGVTNGATSTTGSTAGSLVSWNLTNPDPLLLGETAAVYMVVQVTSPLTNNTPINNDAYSAGAINDDVTVLGNTPVTSTVESAPILEISKTGLPDEVPAGGLLIYTILYTNSGNANATNVIITDTFPVSTALQSESSSPPVTSNTIPGGITWDAGQVNGEGGSGIITLTLTVLTPQAPGTSLTNTVAIASSEVATPTLFTATNLVTSTPVLHIQKTADPNPVAAGSILTYTITYSNSGNANATGVVITDQLDSQVSFNGASDSGVHNAGVVTWSGLTAPAGGVTQTVQVSVTVASPLPNNTSLPNSVTIAAGTVTATDSITTQVLAPSLAVTKVVSPTGVVRAGDNIEYKIIYTNTGGITITLPGILITDTFPVSVTNVISESDRALFQSAAPPEYIWADGVLPPGASGAITMTGQVITSPWASSGGQIDNAVIVAGNGYSATASVASEGRPGLPFTITLTALPPTTQVGNNVLVGANATDVYGNNVFDGTPVTFSTTLSGSNIAPVVVNTNGGIATTNLSSTVVGTSTIAAQIAGVSSALTATTVVTFAPGPVAAFILQATTPQTAGVTFPLTITAVDTFGNLVNTFNGSVTLSDDTGTMTPLNATLNNGIATRIMRITRSTTPNLDIITAISGTITGTVGVEVLPNIPARLNVTVVPTTTQICGTANVTTTLTDQFDNPNPNELIDLSLVIGAGGGNGNLTPISGTTSISGIFNSIFQGTVAGTNVRVQANSGPLTDQSPRIRVNAPAIPTNLTLTVAPNPLATGGNTGVVTATVTDCLGPSAGQVVTFTVSDPALASFTTNPITAITNGSGVATATITSGPTDGTVIITGTVGSLSQTTSLDLRSLALTITKTANPASGEQVRTGQTINYTIQVSNSGTAPVSGVVISDVLPAGVAFSTCTSSPGSICTGGSTTTVTTPTLEVGQSFSANIQVSVTAATTGTVLTNTAFARSLQTSLITSNVVAHSVTTATVDLFLPILLNNFAPLADLQITSFTITGADPNRVISLVIQNNGTTSTGEGFWVDFYVNPTTLPNNPSLGGNRRWEVTGSSQGIAWPVPALGAGQSVILTSNGAPGTIAPAPSPLTQWNGILATSTVYAFVDSFDDANASFVEVQESDENNNMRTPDSIAVAITDQVVAPTSLPDLNNLPPRWQP